MNDILYLFVSCFVVAIVPGPLALIAFHNGATQTQTFILGLFGQLCGLILMVNIIAYAGSKFNLENAKFIRYFGGFALMYLGYSALSVRKKKPQAKSITFFSTFALALTNPKSILGFVPAILLYNSRQDQIFAHISSTGILVIAVSSAMICYFLLGYFFKETRIVKYVRIVSGFLLVLFGVVVLLQTAISSE